MKKILAILALLISATCTQAQVKEDAIEPLMKHRMYTCFEVEYNSVLLVQDMYEMSRFDTLDAVIKYWKHHCGFSERLFSISMLNSIRNNNFKEFISSREFLAPRITSTPVRRDSDLYKSKVLRMLVEYKQATSGEFSNSQFYQWTNGNYPLPKDVNDYYTFYEGYYDFLKFMARSLAGKRAYSPLEQFYLRFYASPDSVRFAELDSAVYQETVLHQQYKLAKRYETVPQGLSYGMQYGYWIPFDGLATFGNRPYFAFHFGGKSYTSAYDLVGGIRIGPSPNYFTVYEQDTLLTSNTFTGYYLGMEMSHTLWHRKKHQFDFLWGLGGEGIQTLWVDLDTANTNDDPAKRDMGSAYLNVGLGYKLYVRNRITKNANRKHSYLSLQARYYMADFGNPGGTDLHGNYLTIGLVYGAYSHAYSTYPMLK